MHEARLVSCRPARLPRRPVQLGRQPGTSFASPPHEAPLERLPLSLESPPPPQTLPRSTSLRCAMQSGASTPAALAHLQRCLFRVCRSPAPTSPAHPHCLPLSTCSAAVAWRWNGAQGLPEDSEVQQGRLLLPQATLSAEGTYSCHSPDGLLLSSTVLRLGRKRGTGPLVGGGGLLLGSCRGGGARERHGCS